MIKFGSIEQFRNIIREVKTNWDYQGKNELEEPIYQHLTNYPVITFKGTVKLHGTNGAIVKYKDRVEFQSRERVLTLTQDNAQFLLSMSNKNLDFLFEGIDFENYIAIFGEWCGGNIQKGIAISNCEKMFVIFACKIDDIWVDFTKSDSNQKIYNILDFPTFQIDIDFEKPELTQNRLIEITEKVEKECPVGKFFGYSGIGEGVVWKSLDHRYTFKVKGEKHSVSKVKVLASVDTEKVESMNEFVENVLTENRLKQGIEYLRSEGLEIGAKSTGDFLWWVVNDVIKEETDTIVENQLDPKKLNSLISNKARQWFFNYQE